jgi:hypothetical protein
MNMGVDEASSVKVDQERGYQGDRDSRSFSSPSGASVL